MVPFYWTGLLAFPRLYDAIKEKTWLCGIVGIFALSIYLLISFYEGDIKTNGMGFYWYKMSLLEFNVYGFFLMLSRYVMGIIGSLGLICLIRFLVVRVVYLSILSPFGQTTLGVYFVQRYIESNAVGCYLAQHYTYSLLGRVGITIVVFLVCHAIIIGMNRNAYVRRLVWLKK
jgi:uncharacterized membrane protein